MMMGEEDPAESSCSLDLSSGDLRAQQSAAISKTGSTSSSTRMCCVQSPSGALVSLEPFRRIRILSDYQIVGLDQVQ